MRNDHEAGIIRLCGVRQNNLKNFDLDLPKNRLIVVTGLSGSGKSSLAFDTLFAEGQRRYIETFSPYARQFFDRMDKPQVDRIEGIPPAIAVEQRNTVRTTRSTVGTMTEICDYMKAVWPHVAVLHCRQCGKTVRKDAPAGIWEGLLATEGVGAEVLIAFSVMLSEKLSLSDSLVLIARQGYTRLFADGTPVRLEEAEAFFKGSKIQELTVLQDRIRLGPENRARFAEACEQAFHFGKGRLEIFCMAALPGGTDVHGRWKAMRFSNRLHCAECDIAYAEPTSALFSFNHPVGACPACHGFGRIITIDYRKAIPDRSLTLAQGAIRPWQTGVSAECQEDLLQYCRKRKVDVNVPFEKLPKAHQNWVIEGDADYGKDPQHEWPHAWYGVKGFFHYLEKRSYKMHVRVMLSRYRAYTLCPDCGGKRFQPGSLLYRVPGPQPVSLADFYRKPAAEALVFLEKLVARKKFKSSDTIGLALAEVKSRLHYLVEAGLGYITLDRPMRSLSGGETERVNLTTCLGTRLVQTLFVLDEPSVGLHWRDTERLVRILETLRDTGNTVVVVEHEATVMKAADQIVDLGPGSGEQGGRIVFQGGYGELLKSADSLTGLYLSGRRRMETPARRVVNRKKGRWLAVRHASLHNLKDLTFELPLGRFVCLSGVSGSGKTTMIREVLMPLLEERLHSRLEEPNEEGNGEDDAADSLETQATEIEGWEGLGQVLLVEQSPLGKTPRSNPAVYSGAFDDLRELFAQSEMARQRGMNASAFSFNSAQGQCERCHGAGYEKIEMQFLSDVFVRCPECNGRRYRSHILEVTISDGKKSWSIADLLEATVDDVVEFLEGQPDGKAAQRARERLKLLREVGLGYLRLGQPINTLSGGESQRMKLVRHLAEFGVGAALGNKPALFLFDEPTTGLHFEDVRVLLKVFQRIVDGGHSVLVIEHNLDVIKSADWVIDLGPEGGEQGGRIVAEGTPETIAACQASHTGRALRNTGALATQAC
jgi:excinuclease ABC subunit A